MDNKELKNSINKLTEHHRKNCRAYDDICNGLSEMSDGCGTEGPFLPVSIFKELDLYSVPEDKLRSRLTSSGTTGQKVSRIYLDGETAADQQRALCEIVGEYIGEKRIPMLIIDSPDVLRDRRKYSARGAGIMGFSMMASRRFYALDNEMKIDMESIKAFVEAAAGGPCFAFGFTYMIWQYFCSQDIVKEAEDTSGMPQLPECYLIHGGGWKKLQDQAVSNEVFKTRLKDLWGIEKVSDYYGMAEQTGSIFMECECGHLHVSGYSDVFALDPSDFSPRNSGEWGLLALESTLPKSYPGHKLMTEDWGRILGEDDCPCGRKGKYFEIQGRIKKSEIRGCSDTFAAEKDSERHPLTGVNPHWNMTADENNVWNTFDDTVMNFLEELSKLFMKDMKYRSVPEVYALGFWCRRAHLEKLKSRQLAIWGNDGSVRKGRGLILHIAPSNMPTMFAYSWICALLAGCRSIVRLSSKENAVTDMILDGINMILERPGFEEIRKQNSFVRFGHSDELLKEISQFTDGRMIWGGDETIAHISSISTKEGCTDITFPDKFSMALLDADRINELSDDELKVQVHLFYNDTYGADQNACSSPKAVFWIGEKNGRDRWWTAFAEETENYSLEPWMATEKYRILCCEYARASSKKLPASEGPGLAVSYGNRLYIVPWNKTVNSKADGFRLSELEAGMGLFHEFILNDVKDIDSFIDSKIQTVVTNVENAKEMIPDVDRIVSIGEALDFDTIWDRKDIISMLSVQGKVQKK